MTGDLKPGSEYPSQPQLFESSFELSFEQLFELSWAVVNRSRNYGGDPTVSGKSQILDVNFYTKIKVFSGLFKIAGIPNCECLKSYSVLPIAVPRCRHQ